MFLLTFQLIATMAGTSESDMLNLMLAVENRDIDKVKDLLNTVDVTSKGEFGVNVLHTAVYSNGEITRLLISHGADKVVNHRTQSISTRKGLSPLFHACINTYEYSLPRMYEIIEAMLKAGGDPNVSDSALRTPLHYVATGSAARLIISYGANVNAKDEDGYTPASTLFLRQFNREDRQVLYALADGNADFAIPNDVGDTIFHLQSDRIPWTKELVTFLSRCGVPLDAANNRGETALTKSLKRHLRGSPSTESISYENLKDSFYARMAEAGANLNASNGRGETPLLLAVLNYGAGMAKWLLENGADVDGKNADGHPPLLALAKREKWNYARSDNSVLPGKDKTDKMKAVIDVLVEGGADVEFLDEAGHNAAHYLRESRMDLLNPKKAEPGPMEKSTE